MNTLFSSDTRRSFRKLNRRFPHWKLFAAVFAITFMGTAAIILLLPIKYESQMKLLVSNAPQDLVISPNDGKSSPGFQDFIENRVNSEIQLMTSTDVLRDVVTRSGLISPSSDGQFSPVSMEAAVNRLNHHLEIVPVKKSDVITVTYKARSPELAARVLHNLRDAYLSMHAQVHAKPGSYKFFDDQANVFAARLTESEAALRAFRAKHPFDNPNQTTALTEKTLEAERSLDDTSAAVSESTGRITRAIKEMGSLDPRVTSQVHTSPQASLITQLNEQLTQMQNRRTELLTKFLPDDRLVKEIDAEIAQTQTVLNAASATPVVETTTDINQIRSGVEKDLAESEVTFTGLKARKATLAALVAGYQQRLAEAAAASTQEDELTRAVSENEQNYLLYSKEREESRIADSLNQQRITDVAVVQAPTFEPNPVSPVIPMDLAIGFLLSLMVAYLSVRAWDTFDRQAEEPSVVEPMPISA